MFVHMECTFSRFFLQRLFVPHDYKDAPITELPILGERRIVKQLDVTFYATEGADISLLFRNGKVRNEKVHNLLFHTDHVIVLCCILTVVIRVFQDCNLLLVETLIFLSASHG